MITLPAPITITDGVAADKAAISVNLSTRVASGKVLRTISVQATPYLVNADGKAVPAGALPQVPAGDVELLAEKNPALQTLADAITDALQAFANTQYAPAEDTPQA